MRGVRSDLVGKRFDRMTVIAYAGKDRKDNTIWTCRCDCGTVKDVKGKDLLSGNVRSCGCLQRERNHEFEDLVGQKFNRLTVIAFDHITPSGHTYWKCRCDCGNIVICQRSHLRYNTVKSCGCLKREYMQNKAVYDNDHGIRRIKIPKHAKPIVTMYGIFSSHDRIVNQYIGMISRCYNPNAANSQYYYNKGIRVSPEWYTPGSRKGITQFINDMYQSYQEHCDAYGIRNTTIDRIDGSKGYSKENCRWATFRDQNNNLSSNRHIYDGHEILTFSECIRKYIPEDQIPGSYSDKPGSLISVKLSRGWSISRILLFLRVARDTGKLLKKKETYEYLIRKIDQSPVYEKYPDEERFPEYENS